jgi:hypothetical protein
MRSLWPYIDAQVSQVIFTHVCHIPFAFSTPWFNNPSNRSMKGGAEILRHLVLQVFFLSFSDYFLFLRSGLSKLRSVVRIRSSPVFPSTTASSVRNLCVIFTYPLYQNKINRKYKMLDRHIFSNATGMPERRMWPVSRVILFANCVECADGLNEVENEFTFWLVSSCFDDKQAARSLRLIWLNCEVIKAWKKSLILWSVLNVLDWLFISNYLDKNCYQFLHLLTTVSCE